MKNKLCAMMLAGVFTVTTITGCGEKPAVSTEQEQSTEPEESTEPEDSKEADESTEPEDSVEADEATEQEDSVEADESTEPEESKESTEPEESKESTEPEESANTQDTEQDTADEKNLMYVFEDSEDANLAAVTFLGYGNEEKEKNFTTFCEQYQLDATQFVEVVDVEDCEWYAVIPKYTEEEIVISHVDMNDGGELEKTEELLVAKEPVLICCNTSDIVPSVDVTITYKDKEVSFNPFISLENGELSEYDGVFEIK